MHAARTHAQVQLVLIDAGVAIDNLDIRDGAQTIPSAFASRSGKVAVGRVLIERGADPNAVDKRSWAPLHFASQYDTTQLLLGQDVDSNTQRDDLWSPLHLASANGHLNVVEFRIAGSAWCKWS